jgi:DNA-binding beta-propeller fold protein YncE
MTSGAAFSPDGRNVYVASAGIRAVAAFSREPQTGAIVQLAGSGACVYRSGVRFPPTPPCATVPSAKFTPVAVVASPDGRNVYVASQTAAEDGAVFVFRRAAASGALTPLPLPDTCVGGAARTVCRKAPQVVLRRGGASSPGGALAISPDGRTVYVAGSSPSGSSEGRNGIVLALRRDPGTGALAPLPGANGCVDGADSPAACAVADALDGVRSLAVSTDGATVYAGTERGAIVVLRRSADGGLAQLPSPHGCLTSDRIPSCGRLPRDALDVEGLAVSRDGRSVYAAAGRLLAFRPR